MNSILDNLHTDHKNFVKVLEFLEQQINLLENCGHSNISLIYDAIRYMKEYPDQVHHPLEDVVFKYYIEHYVEEHDQVEQLLNEHSEIPLLTEKLSTILQGALQDMPQERKKLYSYLKEYISIQKEHMNQEESAVYPVIKKKFNEFDWKTLDLELAKCKDPLFGEQTERSFKGLLQNIIQG